MNDRSSIVNLLGMKLLLISKGTFQLGSEEFPSERPPVPSRLTRDYYLAIHHVTVGQFRRFVKDAGYKTEAETTGKGAEGFDATMRWVAKKPEYNWTNPGFEQRDDHPVVCASWNDAVAFCQWLSKKEGKTYRLPTDTEFEYACRAGTKTHWSCGDTPKSLKEFANVADLSLVKKVKVDEKTLTQRNLGTSLLSSGIAHWEDGFAFTSPVGAFKPNPWGLYDMHGNAWQWCLELTTAGRPPQDPQDAVALAKGTGYRKIRGGAWWFGPGRARSANWANRAQGDSFSYIGFRVACSVD
jgi:formylglycine-generating enzyme required for sulfatase activity